MEKSPTRSTEIRLGQHLVQRRVCTLRQVNQAFAEVRELRAQGKSKSLAQALVENGVVPEDKLRAALAEIGSLELFCPACREPHGIALYSPEVEYRCPRCRTLLVLEGLPPPATPVRPQDAPAASAPEPASLRTPPSAAPSPDAPDPMISKVIGGCQVLGRIARGGMGVVYRARQLNLGRIVALKILTEELSRDRTYVDRFLHEARSAAVLNHGNIVHINDVGEHNGIYYFTMEYVDGENLREVMLKQGTLEVRQALQIALQVSQALQHAHSRGIVHRDIKPENIMMTREGAAKLADLGLAKRVDAVGVLTHAGSIFGTPYYMAPEQAKDFSEVDQRSDIYSLGVTLFKMLTGKVPYEGRTPIEVMIKAIEGKHPQVRELRPEVPAEVEALVERMMDREPRRRFQEAGEVTEAIRALLEMPQKAPAPATTQTA